MIFYPIHYNRVECDSCTIFKDEISLFRLQNQPQPSELQSSPNGSLFMGGYMDDSTLGSRNGTPGFR